MFDGKTIIEKPLKVKLLISNFLKSSVIMNTRERIYLIFFLSIGIILLLIAIVQLQALFYDQISNYASDPLIRSFLTPYIAGFPSPFSG